MTYHPPAYPIQHGLHCPCCQQSTRAEWQQPGLIPTQPTRTYTDCRNPECPAYYDSIERSAFIVRYGQIDR